MSNRVRECQDIEQAIDNFHETIKIACDKAFRRSQATGKTTNIRSIPWWTGELTVMRKHKRSQKEISEDKIKRRSQGTTQNPVLGRKGQV
jgi:hypothetical protein